MMEILDSAPQDISSAGPTLRVASAQFFSGTDVAANAQIVVNYLRAAHDAGAKLVVFPENSNRVRDYTDREECWEKSERLDGEFVTTISAACAELGMYAVVGVDLSDEIKPNVRIASVLIGPYGDIEHVHHKTVFWDYEYTLFVPGTKPLKVIDTPIGRIGLLMCADGIVPDVPRVLGLLGAQIFCNSLNSRGPDEVRVHVPLRTLENHVWHISSNTVGGPADGWPWMGGSQVVSPRGEILACAGEESEGLIWADIDVDAADDKNVPGFTDVFGWRRPDLYGDLMVPHDELPVADMLGALSPDMPAKPVDVATLQVSWFHNREWTIQRAIGQIAHAAKQGAQLGVLPELFCFKPGEVDTDPAAAAATSTEVLSRIRAAATEHSFWVAVHLVARDGDAFYSTAYLIDADGEIALEYRKTHLDTAESLWATAGDELPVAHTALGSIALMIGNEVWVPEVMRLLTLRGAELVLHPTSWDRQEAPDMAATERTEENRVHLVSVNRLDSPAKVGSQIVRSDLFIPGQPIALMRYPSAQWTRYGFEEQLIQRLDLRESHSKMMGHYLDPVGTRQPNLYGPLLVERTSVDV
ncbi:carbon-nitrogen hydrolase family protein [Rhodococcus sp. AD45-ID]|jgi:predicted amidohydrolase|uniref:carbon-nitrogen hydrolase family protein n=1 Tax=Rhodococcus TaxID=1827 RepID=UPI0005E17E3F|nr:MULTISPECIES: carbon-nitrogen hydrolase family protein [Rhodococcus]KJF23680.1 (R)-stereoselective amidase [Rhodococcus sp. AD45]MCE4265429.1 carbon-nitrogen hydrolase family protein [Rhodococcus globerulus]PSR42085.1 carbon-nitrogen hydrolase family protein [Rhodococcus sp. AD45-ID]